MPLCQSKHTPCEKVPELLTAGSTLAGSTLAAALCQFIPKRVIVMDGTRWLFSFQASGDINCGDIYSGDKASNPATTSNSSSSMLP